MTTFLKTLAPIFGKGQKLKVTLVAAASLITGMGGADYLPNLTDTIQTKLTGDTLVHGVIVDMLLEPSFILLKEDGTKIKVPVTIDELNSEKYDMGTYYLKAPVWAEAPVTLYPDGVKAKP